VQRGFKVILDKKRRGKRDRKHSLYLGGSKVWGDAMGTRREFKLPERPPPGMTREKSRRLPIGQVNPHGRLTAKIATGKNLVRPKSFNT